jgi:hypothetical protein
VDRDSKQQLLGAIASTCNIPTSAFQSFEVTSTAVVRRSRRRLHAPSYVWDVSFTVMVSLTSVGPGITSLSAYIATQLTSSGFQTAVGSAVPGAVVDPASVTANTVLRQLTSLPSHAPTRIPTPQPVRRSHGQPTAKKQASAASIGGGVAAAVVVTAGVVSFFVYRHLQSKQGGKDDKDATVSKLEKGVSKLEKDAALTETVGINRNLPKGDFLTVAGPVSTNPLGVTSSADSRRASLDRGVSVSPRSEAPQGGTWSI